MKIVITENHKKKLFAPIGLSGEDSRWVKWNKEQPIKDGEPINQYTHDGKKTGYWEYYSNGNLNFKGLYVNGEKDGYWEHYYDNGNLISKGLYVDGKKDGYWEEYWNNGKLNWKGPYVNGKMDGVWEWYYKDGKLYSKELYKNGELAKLLPLTESEEPKKKKLFAPIGLSGEDSRWLKWNKEQPIKNGKPINQYTQDGKKTGVWEYYYENGDLFFKVSYKDGVEDGVFEYYDRDGNLEYKGSYKNGVEDGVLEHYSSNGKLLYRDLYKNGGLVKRSYMKESEEPKKKLFRPIDLDKRDEQFNNDIKKFLISIKDSFVWDILGRIYVAYNYETDWSDISYYDKENQWMDRFRLEKAFNNLYGEKYSIEDLNKALDNITAFMDNLIFAGENIVYGWCEIEYKGDGHLDFTQHKEVKVEEKMMEIKI